MSSKDFITSAVGRRIVFFFLSSPRVRGPHSYPTQATAKSLPLPHTLTQVARRAADHTVSPLTTMHAPLRARPSARVPSLSLPHSPVLSSGVLVYLPTGVFCSTDLPARKLQHNTRHTSESCLQIKPHGDTRDPLYYSSLAVYVLSTSLHMSLRLYLSSSFTSSGDPR